MGIEQTSRPGPRDLPHRGLAVLGLGYPERVQGMQISGFDLPHRLLRAERRGDLVDEIRRRRDDGEFPPELYEFYGVFYGGWVAVLPAVVMDHFGGRNVSGIIGILYTSVAFGTLIGPSAAGFAFDFSHSYTLPILASAGANIVAAAIVATTSRAAPYRRKQASR